MAFRVALVAFALTTVSHAAVGGTPKTYPKQNQPLVGLSAALTFACSTWLTGRSCGKTCMALPIATKPFGEKGALVHFGRVTPVAATSEAAEARGIFIGAATNHQHAIDDEAYLQLVVREFNLITAENA